MKRYELLKTGFYNGTKFYFSDLKTGKEIFCGFENGLFFCANSNYGMSEICSSVKSYLKKKVNKIIGD